MMLCLTLLLRQTYTGLWRSAVHHLAFNMCVIARHAVIFNRSLLHLSHNTSYVLIAASSSFTASAYAQVVFSMSAMGFGATAIIRGGA